MAKLKLKPKKVTKELNKLPEWICDLPAVESKSQDWDTVLVVTKPLKVPWANTNLTYTEGLLSALTAPKCERFKKLFINSRQNSRKMLVEEYLWKEHYAKITSYLELSKMLKKTDRWNKAKVDTKKV